jgi:hypothetical protein
MEAAEADARETLNESNSFGLSLSKPLISWAMPFDKPRANGIVQHFPASGRTALFSISLAGSERPKLFGTSP